MRLFTIVLAVAIVSILFGNILNKIETIEQLENQLEQKHFQIDSLQNEFYENSIRKHWILL